jgi:hypothetical protein
VLLALVTASSRLVQLGAVSLVSVVTCTAPEVTGSYHPTRPCEVSGPSLGLWARDGGATPGNHQEAGPVPVALNSLTTPRCAQADARASKREGTAGRILPPGFSGFTSQNKHQEGESYLAQPHPFRYRYSRLWYGGVVCTAGGARLAWNCMDNQPGSERSGQGLLSPSPRLTVRLSATPQHPQPGRAVQGQELAMSDPAGSSFHRWNLEHGRDARRWRLATVRDMVILGLLPTNFV